MESLNPKANDIALQELRRIVRLFNQTRKHKVTIHGYLFIMDLTLDEFLKAEITNFDRLEYYHTKAKYNNNKSK